MKNLWVSICFVVIGAFIFLFNTMFFYDNSQIFTILNVLSVVIALAMPLLIKYQEYQKIKIIEKKFPIFLCNITENIKSGMTLPQALESCADTNYGNFSKYVQDIAAKINWGISFERVLEDFADKTGSEVVKRTVKSINEAHESGGRIDTILDAISNSVQEIEIIKKKRSTRVYSQMLNGYFIYIMFLGVIFALSNFLIPAFQTEAGGTEMQVLFNEMFRNLVVIQGIFAGLSIGKMAEGNLIAGFKHSLVLVVLGYTLFAVV